MTSDGSIPKIALNNGVEIPQIGLGLGNGKSEGEMLTIVPAALQAGYRSFDTATRYRNEHALGLALKRSGIPRDEVFITTKVWNTDQGYVPTLRAFDASLDRLGFDYLDLYLIHFPAPMQGLYLETWRALETLYRSGRVRSIGLSNFKSQYLSNILKKGTIVPAVNQVELHPRLQQGPLRAEHEAHGIKTEAWSPLAHGLMLHDRLFALLAARHRASVAQVIIRWHLQLGNIVIPKTVTPSRMRENIDAIDLPPFDHDDMTMIKALDCNLRSGPDPDEYLQGMDYLKKQEMEWSQIAQ